MVMGGRVLGVSESAADIAMLPAADLRWPELAWRLACDNYTVRYGVKLG